MQKIIKELIEVSKKNKVSIIRESNLIFLQNYLKNHSYLKKILEIGTGCGFSALCLSLISSIQKIDTVEKDLIKYEIAKYYLEKNPKISLFNADINLFETASKYDAIFLDGPKKKILNLIDKFKKNLNPKGIFIIDNFYLKDIREKYLKTKAERLKKIIESNDLLQQEIKNLSKKFYNLVIDSSGDGLAIIENKS